MSRGGPIQSQGDRALWADRGPTKGVSGTRVARHLAHGGRLKRICLVD